MKASRHRASQDRAISEVLWRAFTASQATEAETVLLPIAFGLVVDGDLSLE
jgi:hypothetical protein